MPWKTLCGFPPNGETITLRIPNGLWRPDTVITDYEGTEMFVLLDQVQQMRSYEAIFGDLDGRRLVCIKRHLISAFWRDGYYFCTYKPNYKNQRPLLERDVDNKKVYPFSYLQVSPMKGRFFYRMFDNQEGLSPPKMRSENPWLGFMVVCCTPMVRTGKWTASFRRKNQNMPTIHVDQWRNCVDIGPGNDVLAALCMAYVFDRYQCQPLVTVVGAEKEQYLQPDDQSIESNEDNDGINDIEQQDVQMYFDNAPSKNDQNGTLPVIGERQSNNDTYANAHDEQENDYDDFLSSPGDKDHSLYTSEKDYDNVRSDTVVASERDDDLLSTSSFNVQQPSQVYDADNTTGSGWLTTDGNAEYNTYTNKSGANDNHSYINKVSTVHEEDSDDEDKDDDSKPKIV